MNTNNKKGFVQIIVIVCLLIIVSVAGYFVVSWGLLESPEFVTTMKIPNNAPALSPVTPSNSDEPASSKLNSVTVNKQMPGPDVIVASVTIEHDGWVVVHDERGGQLGAIIAARRVNAGTTQNVVVDLLGKQTEAGKNYYAVAYSDDGDKKFDYKLDFPLKDAQGNVIATKFMVITL